MNVERKKKFELPNKKYSSVIKNTSYFIRRKLSSFIYQKTDFCLYDFCRNKKIFFFFLSKILYKDYQRISLVSDLKKLYQIHWSKKTYNNWKYNKILSNLIFWLLLLLHEWWQDRGCCLRRYCPTEFLQL